MARLKAASRVWLAPIWGETGQLAAGTDKSPQGLPIPCAGKGLNLSPSKPECKNINYDPLVMSDGIAPTDDPVLLFRSPSYAVSFVKRLQGQ